MKLGSKRRPLFIHYRISSGRSPEELQFDPYYGPFFLECCSRIHTMDPFPWSAVVNCGPLYDPKSHIYSISARDGPLFIHYRNSFYFGSRQSDRSPWKCCSRIHTMDHRDLLIQIAKKIYYLGIELKLCPITVVSHYSIFRRSRPRKTVIPGKGRRYSFANFQFKPRLRLYITICILADIQYYASFKGSLIFKNECWL